MVGWLAIIIICAGGQCEFLAETKTPYYSEASCKKIVLSMAEEMTKRGAEVPMISCIPIRWVKA
jgi:hypothetical protein